MLIIRCARKLLKGLDAEVPSERMLPTNRLGDWYANFLFARRARLIICVSERSLLPVFVEAGDPSSFIPRFQEAVRSVLQVIPVIGPLTAIRKASKIILLKSPILAFCRKMSFQTLSNFCLFETV